MGFAFAVEPNEFSCAAVRFGTGLSYALIYSSLLVKLVFLVSEQAFSEGACNDYKNIFIP
jgi:hypothetical protein